MRGHRADSQALKNEIIWTLPTYFGHGIFKNIRFSSGMEISLSHCALKKDYHARVEQALPMITFGFSVSGITHTTNSCHDTPITMEDNDSYVHYFEDTLLHRTIACATDFRGLVIRMSPEIFTEMLLNDCEEASTACAATIRKMTAPQYFSTHKTTPKMKIALFEIFNCPHKGIVRKILLESKAMELIGYKIEQISGNSPGQDTSPPLTAGDRDRVYFARDIIADSLQNPPLLPDLAKSVGMTHTKLNRCFRDVFGCTVFDYLRRERLEYASLLLCEDKMSITDVAFEAGFCSSSHLAASFLKYSGVTPKVYRKNYSTDMV